MNLLIESSLISSIYHLSSPFGGQGANCFNTNEQRCHKKIIFAITLRGARNIYCEVKAREERCVNALKQD